VINQAIHTLDLLLMLFGPIARVDARVATRLHDIEVEDTAVAALEFESGALGVFEASTAVFPGYARRVELTGTTGTLILQHDALIEHRLGPDLDFCLGNRRENQDLTPTNTTLTGRVGRQRSPARARGFSARHRHQQPTSLRWSRRTPQRRSR
jgi:predicted dehydrogenase